MAIPQVLKTKEEIAALNEAKAKLLQEIDLKKTELKGIVESIDEARERSGFLPSTFKQAQQEHSDRVAELEAQVIEKRTEVQELSDKYDTLTEDIAKLGTLKGDLEEEIKQLTTDAENGRVELKSLTDEVNIVKGKVAALKRELEAENTRLSDEIKDKKRILTDTIAETDKRKKEIEEEEKLLAVKRNDLEIYEMRLRKQYPDATIILEP